MSLEFDGKKANYMRDTRPESIIIEPVTTICGFCKLITEVNGEIVEETHQGQYCGEEFIDKDESSTVSIGNISIYWACTKDSI